VRVGVSKEVNAGPRRIGEDSSALLGGLPVTTIGLAGYSRADLDSARRRDFFVYVDEFQNFTTLALANMLSEMRKYRIGFTVAHQYLHQLDPDNPPRGSRQCRHDNRLPPGRRGRALPRASLMMCSRRRTWFNSRTIEFTLKLMIGGAPSPPFSAITIPAWP
jgi:hypothetical protein